MGVGTDVGTDVATGVGTHDCEVVGTDVGTIESVTGTAVGTGSDDTFEDVSDKDDLNGVSMRAQVGVTFCKVSDDPPLGPEEVSVEPTDDASET